MSCRNNTEILGHILSCFFRNHVLNTILPRMSIQLVIKRRRRLLSIEATSQSLCITLKIQNSKFVKQFVRVYVIFIRMKSSKILSMAENCGIHFWNYRKNTSISLNVKFYCITCQVLFG